MSVPAVVGPLSAATFRQLMDAWVALLAQVAARSADSNLPTLKVYRWQPHGNIATPALFNWLLPSQWVVKDSAQGQDTVALVCRLGLDHTPDGTIELDYLEDYVDLFRQVVDPQLWTPANRRPLEGTVYRAQRQTMQMETLDIGQPLLCVGFNMQFDVERRIR